MRTTLVASVVGLLLLGASGPMHQLGLLSLDHAYDGVRIAVALAFVTALFAIGILATTARHRSVRSIVPTTVALGLAIFTMVVPVQERIRLRSAPPLHDITTDLQHPPVFNTLVDVQEAASHLPRPAHVDALQTQAYPDIAPIVLPVTSDMAFEETLETFAELDWPVIDGSQDEGWIETTVRSGWFGFKDDLAVRFTPIGNQTRVDVRSVARDGADDGGRNAEHVREFLEELQR